MVINILGTLYSISELAREEDKELSDCNGYCDHTTKNIVIVRKPDDSTLGNWEVYRKKLLRHEIIHAFLFESGLHENFDWHDETVVDWIAALFPKMQMAFGEAGCL